MNVEDPNFEKKEENYVLDKHNFIDDKTVIVEEKNNRMILMIIILIIALLLSAFGATYSYINFNNLYKLNKDIDNDGIPDLNIVIEGYNKSNINIDINNDNKPDLNIDYKGNLKPIFNVDKDNDGIADFNLINQDINSDGKCDLNCDTDSDGWPDINIDLDGDNKADIDIDLDGDSKADLNLDLDGDSKCDLNCDTDSDGKCDLNCIKECNTSSNGQQSCEIIIEKEVIKTIIIEKVVKSGSSTKSENTSIQGAKLLVTFIDNNEVKIEDEYSINQIESEFQEQKIILDKVFTIQNIGEITALYSLKWFIIKNEFISNNLKFKVSSTNGGGILNSFTSLPLNDQFFLSNISIAPGVIQTYTVSFILENTNNHLQLDQTKIFSGEINAELIN